MADCKYPAIPFPSGVDQNVKRILDPIKETLDIFTGRIGNDETCRIVTVLDLIEGINITVSAPGSGGVSVHNQLSGLDADDHTQYQLRTEKGSANGYAGLDASSYVPTANLGSGTASSSTFLRGDQSWATAGGLFSEDANNNIVGGTGAGAALTTGADNFLAGKNAGALLTTESDCVMIGNGAGAIYDFYDGNVLIGKDAGAAQRFGFQTTYIGFEAGLNNTNSYCTFLGYQAAKAGTSLNSCTIIGAGAGSNAQGNNATFIGVNAGQNVQDSPNIAIGNSAAKGVVAGSDGANNIAIGFGALENFTDADENVCIGSNAALNLTTGDQNVAIGHNAGDVITSGSGNVVIGHNIDPLSATGSNQLAIGNATYPMLRGDMANYQLAIYGSSGYLNFNTTLGSTGYGIRDNAGTMEYKDSGGSWTTFTSLSDRRLKNDIHPYHVGLEFIEKLKVKSFKRKDSGQYECGLIAQDVKAAMDDLCISFSGWYERPDGMQGLWYERLVLPLINAVVELKKEIDELKGNIKCQAHTP